MRGGGGGPAGRAGLTAVAQRNRECARESRRRKRETIAQLQQRVLDLETHNAQLLAALERVHGAANDADAATAAAAAAANIDGDGVAPNLPSIENLFPDAIPLLAPPVEFLDLP